MADLKFGLADDLSISHLRNAHEWKSRLKSAGKLRLQRRGETLGVLVSASEWRDLAGLLEHYERAIRLLENEHDRRLIVEREGGLLLQGDELRAAVERELDEASLG